MESTKPPWWHKVKEVDLDEAKVLLSIGVDVRTAYKSAINNKWPDEHQDGPCCWCTVPSDLTRYEALFYVRKGASDDERSQ